MSKQTTKISEHSSACKYGSGKISSCMATKLHPMCGSMTQTNKQSSPSIKVKRFKTRKERNQLRGQEKNKFNSRCNNTECTVKRHSRHISSPFSKKRRLIAKPIVPQKPSIITTGRLTSIQGLFSHELRSLDIDRLVSDEIKSKKRGAKQNLTPLQATSALPETCAHDENHDPESCCDTAPKSPSRELTAKNNSSQPNRRCKAPETSTKDRKHDHDNARQEATSKARPKSPVSIDTSTLKNKLGLDNILDESKNCFDAGNEKQRFTKSQRSEATSALSGPQNVNVMEIDVCSPSTKQTSSLQLVSGISLLKEHNEQGKQKPELTEAMRNLTTHFYQTADLSFPRVQPPLLDKTRETLQQVMQKRHGFLLEHNLHRLYLHVYGHRNTRHFNSELKCDDGLVAPFNPVRTNEDSTHRRRDIKRWIENAWRQDQRKFNLDSEKGDLFKIRRSESISAVSPPLCLNELQPSHTSQLPHWMFQHPSMQLLNLDQGFPHLPEGLHRLDTANLFFQPPQRINEGMANRGFEFCDLSQSWRPTMDLGFNSGLTSLKRKHVQPELSVQKSMFFSNLQAQSDYEKWRSNSISSSDGFHFEPYSQR